MCAVLSAAAAVAATPATPAGPRSDEPPAPLIVTRFDDVADAPDGLTIRAALRQAASDPRDNVIRFDAAAVRAAGGTITLARPLIFAPPSDTETGNDLLDGGGADSSDTIPRVVVQASSLSLTAHRDINVLPEEAGTMPAPQTDRPPENDTDGRTAPTRRAVTIRAGAGASAVLVIRRGSLTVQNAVFRGGRERTALVTDGGRLQLDRCRVGGSGGPGVTAIGPARIEITGGLIAENRSHGIELYGEAQAHVTDAQVRNNTHAGLAAFASSQAVFQGGELTSNGQWGLIATDNASVRAEHVLIRRSGFANADAAEHARMELEDCRLTDGDRFGALAGGNAALILRRCTVSGHAMRGIESQAGADVDLRDCTIEDSGNFGIVLFGRSTLRAEGGAVRRNRGHGIAVRDQATADVRDCTFEGNEYSGIGAPDARDGGRLSARRCIFRGNGMRPIFRGPMHLDPLVPTVARIDGDRIRVRTVPRATVDLYADRVGEAARLLRTVTADETGAFDLTVGEAPPGEVITAAATTPDGQTSEYNVIGARPDRAILAALVARTGPLSDAAGGLEPAATVQRWRPGSRVVFRFDAQPDAHVEAYVRWFTGCLPAWTGGGIAVAAQFGRTEAAPAGAIVVPIRCAAADDDTVRGTGGTTFTQWDSSGFFTPSVRILLAAPPRGEPACPRVIVHEMCHALGLYHARVGLLSRMQGIPAAAPGYLNDFAPAPTFFDVAAIQMLYETRMDGPATFAQVSAAAPLRLAAGTADSVAIGSPAVSPSDRQPAPDVANTLSAPPASRR